MSATMEEIQAEIRKIESDKIRIKREVAELIDQHAKAGVHPDVILSGILNALNEFRG